MRVNWQDVRRGQNQVLTEQEGHDEVIGGFRETKRGIDAYAQTFSYEPGRSQKGFATIEDAKDFVESFRPWELHGVQDVTVDRDPRPVADPGSIAEPVPSAQPTESAVPDAEPVPSVQPTESAVPEHQPLKRWWEFWRRG